MWWLFFQTRVFQVMFSSSFLYLMETRVTFLHMHMFVTLRGLPCGRYRVFLYCQGLHNTFLFFRRDISILVTPHFGECFFRSAFQKHGCKVMFTLGLLVVITLFCDGMVLCTSCMLTFDVCMVRHAPADGHGCLFEMRACVSLCFTLSVKEKWTTQCCWNAHAPSRTGPWYACLMFRKKMSKNNQKVFGAPLGYHSCLCKSWDLHFNSELKNHALFQSVSVLGFCHIWLEAFCGLVLL